MRRLMKWHDCPYMATALNIRRRGRNRDRLWLNNRPVRREKGKEATDGVHAVLYDHMTGLPTAYCTRLYKVVCAGVRCTTFTFTAHMTYMST